VTHTCNPTYSEGRDQEDCGSKTALANSLRPDLENTQQKKLLAEWLKLARPCIQTPVPSKKERKEDSKMAARGRKQKARLL
jgi:hypothetical protein